MKNKPKNEYTKNYYERYAKLTLKYIYPDIYCKFEEKDSPDLQNPTSRIGIEVCRAISGYDGNFSSFVNENIHSDKTDEELTKSLCKRLKREYPREISFEIKTYKGMRMFSPHKGLVNTSIYIHKLETAILKKCEKIPLYNEKLKWTRLGLYLFAGFTLDEHDIKALTEKILKNNINFDLYIINCTCYLYVIYKDGTIKTFQISENDLKIIKTKALTEQ